MELYRRLLSLILPSWRRLVLAMLCMVVVAGCASATAFIIAPVIDDIFGNRKSEMVMPLALGILMIFLIKAISLCSNAYLMSEVNQRIITQLREQVYNHITSLPLPHLDQTKTGGLMARILNDVGMVQTALSDAFSGSIKETFSIVFLLGVVFYRDWPLAIVGTIVLPVAFIPLFKFGKILRRTGKQSQSKIADLSVILHETIGGNRIVKAFGMEQYEKDRFQMENRTLLKLTMRAVVFRALNSAVMEFAGGIGIVAVIMYGGYKVIAGEGTLGNFTSFLAGLIMLYEPVKRLANIHANVQQGLAAATRVYETLDLPVENVDEPGARELPPIRQGIEFHDVCFRYGEKPVLSDINFTVSAGQVVAVVGMSGAGKTTLVNLIPRFYELTGGQILIDGIDTRTVTIASLRKQIAIVTQQTILFNDSVRNNIAYGDISRSEEEIVAAARAANAYDFIMKLPEGFGTLIGEQGIRLSGGERQRISIARALLKDAPILILDEATSSLDSDSELEVQRALDNLMSGRTTVVIAHRLSTIQNADLILTLSKGRIVEQGRHDELMTANSEYRRLYHLQFAQVAQDGRGISPGHS
ncbi:MAG: ATP-binding cassette domain-containing protein [Desulfobacteraceae bacterium]|nr:ATP-binding cassette domain-containing protein [Desulfobacteraceae bacterium]